MDDKKFSMIVLTFIFIVAVPSLVFLFSNNDATANVSADGSVDSWIHNGNKVLIYPNKVIAFDLKNRYGTGFYYDSPVFSVRLGNSAGCPRECYSIRHEDVKNFQKYGFRIDFYGNRLYCCWCPENGRY